MSTCPLHVEMEAAIESYRTIHLGLMAGSLMQLVRRLVTLTYSSKSGGQGDKAVRSVGFGPTCP